MDDSDRESQYSDDEEDVYYMWWEDSDESDEENSISEDDSMTDATPTVPILEDPNVQLDQNVSQSTQPNENQMGLAIHSVGRSVASNDQTNKRKLSQRDKDEMTAAAKKSIESGAWHTKKKAKTTSRSYVWDYIHEIYDDEKQIEQLYYCTMCKEVILNPYSDGNTNVFRRHSCNVQQQNKKSSIIIRPNTKKDLKAAACNFIAKDLRPYSAIEGEGLLDLCHSCMKLGQTYPKATVDDLRNVMPTRNTVKLDIEKTAKEVQNQIKVVLQSAKEVGGFAVTSDTWTDKHRRLTYICLVAHCNIITPNGIERHRFNLYLDQITELVKSGNVIVKNILTVLGEYGFTENEVKEFVTFITDRGSNFKYGLLSNGFERLNCYAHLIHNLVKSMLKSDEAKLIMKNAAKVIAYVRNSSVNCQLNESLKSFSRTRWNGSYAMLASIAVNFDHLHSLLYERQRANPKLTCFDSMSSLKSEELVAISGFLLQFKEVSERLEGENYETLSLVWPVYTEIWSTLQPDDDNGERPKMIIEQMKSAGLKYFKTRDKDFKPTKKHKIASVLNPNFKRLPNVLDSERYDLYDSIETMLNTDQATVSSPNEEPEKSPQRQIEEVHPFFRSFCTFAPVNPTIAPTELRRYLDQNVDLLQNVTDWWNSHRKEFPQLFRLFAKISCIPASSSSGERSFSRAGLVVTDLRSRILPKNLNNIIVVNNLRKMNKQSVENAIKL